MSPADPTAITAPLTNRIGPNPGVGQLPLPVGVIMAVVAFDLGHSRLHRWHHSTVYDEGDSNYGAVTSGWDRVFGTWFRPTQRNPMWLMPVSIICGRRAAGRYRMQYESAHKNEPPFTTRRGVRNWG